MAIDSKIPEISALRQKTEAVFGLPLKVHSDFVALADEIFERTREHLSETTLERLWNYSTRGYATVSRHTLDVVCSYAGFGRWTDFILSLKEESGEESGMFDDEKIEAEDLRRGDRIRIGWQPDRVCVLRYLGDYKFVAEQTTNSKMRPGDTFRCLRFQLGTPVYLENLTDSSGNPRGSRYGIGLRNGLSMLQRLQSP